MSNFDQIINKDELKKIITSIELLEEKRQELKDEIKDIYVVSKRGGFDVRIIREIIRRRKLDDDYVLDEEIINIYLKALN